MLAMSMLPTDRGIIATAHATGAENLAIPLPRPRPVIRIPRPRLGSFPGKTQLMDFESAPFPYDGKNPMTGQPFFNVFFEGRFGRRGARGQVYWENDTYTDPRVLLHIPKGFDIRKPAVMVVFFHGHGARIDRDVRDRQQVAAQITRSDANAVVVAPQFAVDAADSSPGAFWEPGFFDEFLSEASEQFALMLGQPKAVRTFFRMPVVFISYSGGFVPTAWALRLGHLKDRLRGIVLMDSLYGELEHFREMDSGKPARLLHQRLSRLDPCAQSRTAARSRRQGHQDCGIARRGHQTRQCGVPPRARRGFAPRLRHPGLDQRPDRRHPQSTAAISSVTGKSTA